MQRLRRIADHRHPARHARRHRFQLQWKTAAIGNGKKFSRARTEVPLESFNEIGVAKCFQFLDTRRRRHPHHRIFMRAAMRQQRRRTFGRKALVRRTTMWRIGRHMPQKRALPVVFFVDAKCGHFVEIGTAIGQHHRVGVN